MSKLLLNDFTQKEQRLFCAILHAHTIEDVRSKCPEGTSLNDLSTIAERAQNIVSKSDSYFESYWDCVDAAIEEAGLSVIDGDE